MGIDDEFESLMEDCVIGDFSDFMLSEEEMEKGKQERKEQVSKDVEELKGLIKEVEKLKEEGKAPDNKTIRRMKQLSNDKLVLIAAMSDTSVDELVEMEMGDSKKEKHTKHVNKTAEMIDILKKSLESENPMEALEKLTIAKESLKDGEGDALCEDAVSKNLYYDYRKEDSSIGTPDSIILIDSSKYDETGIHSLNANTTKAIEQALENAGIDVVEMMECVYEIPGISEEKILDILSARFTLSKIPN